VIRLPEVTLEADARRQLDAWQRELNAASLFPDRVEKGKATFKLRNVKSDKTFRRVRATLRRMCGGAVRCAYCEHSTPDEVEHIWPKDFYPERVFDWFNYLYACGTCNGRKLNHWCVRDAQDNLHNLKRSETERSSKNYGPPPVGDPMFIDPRDEDPMRFLRVDLLDTFEVAPRTGLDDHAQKRAVWTIEKLELNLREDLVGARANHYFTYIDRLKQHIVDRDAGESEEDLHLRVECVRRMDHPMVWREMQRSHRKLPRIAELFVQAPEALSW